MQPNGRYGSFSVVIGPNSLHTRFGQTVFLISQHILNKLLLEYIFKQFNVGYLGSSKTKPAEINYRVTSKKDLIIVIIPFFESYPTLGVHSINYFKWKKIIEYILESKDIYKGKEKKNF